MSAISIRIALACTAVAAFCIAGSAAAQTSTNEPKPAAKAPTKATGKEAGKPKTAPAKTKQSACSPTDKGSPVKVKLTTSMGAITLELNREKAPISSANFVKYVESGHYNGTIFHRVINGFMIQGGGFTTKMEQKSTNPPIQNESTNGLTNDVYTVAMARTGVRDSATSQFFINVKNNDFLNFSGDNPSGWGYAVFGKVVEGMDIVDQIKSVPTGNAGMHQNVPVTPVVIEKAECIV